MISEQGWARVRGVLRRRWRATLLTGGLALALAIPLLWSLDPGYRASAVVRALESQPAHEYVAPTVAEQIGERLKTLRLAAMARPLIAEVATDLGLPTALHRTLDEVVDAIRSRMEVKVEGEDTFLLSYEDRDPARAQEIVNRVAARFMERQVRRRADVAAATERALEREVTHLRPKLAGLETVVRDFKLSHYGSLPEQQEENLRTLDQTTLELNIQTSNLDLANERRRQLLAASMSPLRHQEELLATALHAARTRYTPGHPEVTRIAGELAQVRVQRLGDERTAHDEALTTNPEVQGIDREIRRTESLITALRDRQTTFRARVADTAKNAEQLARLATDLDVVKAKYQASLGRLHEASLSGAIEHSLAGMRYELVEGAARPRAAAHPQRALWAVGALLVALGLGLGAGFALDLRDTAIYSPEEVAAAVPDRDLPVLACVPDLSTRPERSGSDA